MSDRFKKIFLAISISIPFLLYCIYYYSIMIRNAPFKFAEFKGIVVKGSDNGKIDQSYSTYTKDYIYVNERDSTIHHQVKLSKKTLEELHFEVAKIGLWNMPDKMLGDSTGNAPRYYVEFDYQRKKKIIEIDAAFAGDPKLKDAALQVVKTVNKAIADADDRENP